MKSKGLNWEVNQSSAGGATLKEHWMGEKELKTREFLSQSKYTKIVFQDKSTYPLIAIDTTKKIPWTASYLDQTTYCSICLFDLGLSKYIKPRREDYFSNH